MHIFGRRNICERWTLFNRTITSNTHSVHQIKWHAHFGQNKHLWKIYTDQGSHSTQERQNERWNNLSASSKLDHLAKTVWGKTCSTFCILAICEIKTPSLLGFCILWFWFFFKPWQPILFHFFISFLLVWNLTKLKLRRLIWETNHTSLTLWIS